MIKVKNVELTRLEGPIDDCGTPLIFDSMKEANDELKKWSLTAPKTGGYDKCAFLVRFEDGREYDDRYDLKHYSCDQDHSGEINISTHIREHLEFIVGKRRPGWMSDGEWEQACDLNKTYREDAQAFLNNYEL